MAKKTPELRFLSSLPPHIAPLVPIDDAAEEAAPSLDDQEKDEPTEVAAPPREERKANASKAAKRGGKDKPRRGVVARADGRELRRLTVYVELDIAQRLRQYCFEKDLPLSDIAAEALGKGLRLLERG